MIFGFLGFVIGLINGHSNVIQNINSYAYISIQLKPFYINYYDFIMGSYESNHILYNIIRHCILLYRNYYTYGNFIVCYLEYIFIFYYINKYYY